MKPKQVTVIRIDPEKQAIARLVMPHVADFAAGLKRMVRAKEISFFELMKIEEVRMLDFQPGMTKPVDKGPMPLIVVAGQPVTTDLYGWKLKAIPTVTAGISVIFGFNAQGHVWDCPISPPWLRERIEWLAPAQTVDPE